jgi:hypothetical protein
VSSKSILIYLSFAFSGATVAGVSGLKENNRTTCGLVVESADQMDHVGDWSCTLTIEAFHGKKKHKIQGGNDKSGF